MADGSMGATLDQRVFDVNIGWLANGQHCQTGFSVRDVAVNDNDAQDVVDAVDPFANGLFKGLLLTTDKLLFVDVVRLFSEDSARKEYVDVAGTNGPASTTYLPTFLCAQIALKRQARKRYGQGRMFWPIRQDTWVDGDVLTGPAVTAIQSIIDDLNAKFTGVSADLHLCNHHLIIPARPQQGSTPARAEIAPHWYDVDNVILKTDVTVMKSRKVGKGS
jgi:hypothetical protein